jgi:hypothetical protein
VNVNTYDATPMYEGTVSGNWKPRTLKDAEGDLWFEIRPGKFVYTPEQTREAARKDFGLGEGILDLDMFEDTEYTFV